MQNYKRFALTLIFLSLSLALHADPPDSAKSEPFLLKMGMFAPMSSKRSWTLTVDGDGLAQLNIATYPKDKKRTFHVSAKQMAHFRKVVAEQQFFALGAEYGDHVPDSSERTLTLQQGQQTKSVKLGFLRAKDPKLPEIRRALRIWNIAQDWFHDDTALDLRPYEKEIMPARPLHGKATP